MKKNPTFTRREWMGMLLAGSIAGIASIPLLRRSKYLFEKKQAVFTVSIPDYGKDISGPLLNGFKELGITPKEIKGKRVLLKPNMVEPHETHTHINTHPLVIRGAIEAFLSLGAGEVVVAEGPGHRRDILYCLEKTGLGEILQEDAIPFVDLNTMDFVRHRNQGNRSSLGDLFLPSTITQADFIVSMAKMKTHHWAGVTLSMKNMFGVMPGRVYGWPKNRLHSAGIVESILDINATVCPDFAIIDGIVGMEGDGPIMGTPIHSKVLVMGRNPAAVDASGARIMGIDPARIDYLRKASGWLGSINERNIEQRGEPIRAIEKQFNLIQHIPAHQNIRKC
jgi:uncharacterized protein (DUF362 family)